jgi:hypothetical protein
MRGSDQMRRESATLPTTDFEPDEEKPNMTITRCEIQNTTNYQNHDN